MVVVEVLIFLMIVASVISVACQHLDMDGVTLAVIGLIICETNYMVKSSAPKQ